MSRQSVPKALSTWFVIHFVADIAFAIPLLLFPVTFLGILGWHTIDPFSVRIVAAALFGIGIESWLGRNASADTFKNMLNLKIIWSGATVIGTILSIIQSSYSTRIAEWLLLLVFLVFHIIWVFWRIRVSKILAQS